MILTRGTRLCDQLRLAVRPPVLETEPAAVARDVSSRWCPAVALDRITLVRGVVPAGPVGTVACRPPRGPSFRGVPVDGDHVASTGSTPPGGLDGLAGEGQPISVQRRLDEPVVGTHVGAGFLGEGQILQLRDPPCPGFFPASESVIRASGQIRNLSALVIDTSWAPKTSCGGRWKRMVISVAVTGMALPARIRRGTPAHRQESSASRTAT